MRILIVLGAESPPTFVRNQVNGLVRSPGFEVGVLAKAGIQKYTPDVKVLVSEFRRWSAVRMIGCLLLAMLKDRRTLFKAAQLTNPEVQRKVWLKRLYRTYLVVRFNPTVIHFQWAAHTLDYSKLILSKEYKCLVSLRGTQVNVEPLLDVVLAEHYRRIFPNVYLHAVSEAMKQKALSWGGNELMTKVIYSPVPQFFFEAFELGGWSPSSPLKVLSIGRFHWIKGYSYAIEAIHLLLQEGYDVEYTIIAQGDVPAEILYQIKDRRMEGSVHIQSGVDYSGVVGVMKSNHVLLLSSVEEGIANVVLEAMAVGLPVVCTDCGGMREVVDSGVTGWIVPVRNAAAIKNGLLNVLRMSEREVIAMRRKAHESVKSRFDFEKNISEFVSLYKWVGEQTK